MGVPDSAFSFGRILEILLRDRYPKAEIEVINAAMTAINSHVVLPIVRESTDLEPDLFVLYLGNNEVVGPYGPGTIFDRSPASLDLLRATIWLNATKIGQVAQDLAADLEDAESSLQEWKGMEMFLEGRVPADDPP